MKHVAQRKAMLLSQRNVQPVIGRRRLQLKIESHAEPFAQRQSPRLVDAAAKGRMDHQLHPAASSKNLSAITVVCVGTAPSTARPCSTYSVACSAPESSSPHSS